MTSRKITPLPGAAEKSAQVAALSRTIDLRGFIAFLERVTTEGRMERVRAMMRLDRFLLWHEAAEDHLTGVLQGTVDPSSRHACRLDRDGRVMCCTPALDPCDGLGDKLCEHVAALMLALVQYGVADARVVAEWAARAAGRATDLDGDAMTAAFARCEAG